MQLSVVEMIYPSEHLRPEAKFASKAITDFRDYSIDENDPIKERVRKTYLEMHTHQTHYLLEGRSDDQNSNPFEVTFF